MHQIPARPYWGTAGHISAREGPGSMKGDSTGTSSLQASLVPESQSGKGSSNPAPGSTQDHWKSNPTSESTVQTLPELWHSGPYPPPSGADHFPNALFWQWVKWCLTWKGNMPRVCLHKEKWECARGGGVFSPDFFCGLLDGKQFTDMKMDGFSCCFSLWHHAAGTCIQGNSRFLPKAIYIWISSHFHFNLETGIEPMTCMKNNKFIIIISRYFVFIRKQQAAGAKEFCLSFLPSLSHFTRHGAQGLPWQKPSTHFHCFCVTTTVFFQSDFLFWQSFWVGFPLYS